MICWQADRECHNFNFPEESCDQPDRSGWLTSTAARGHVVNMALSVTLDQSRLVNMAL